MAEYTSRHTGLQIDEALDSALNVKQVRGIVKITDAGPVAAVPDEDFIADSGSIVSVTGLLKGVRNAETNKIEVQQATAGTDYQTPLTAGADYATPTAVANKQNKINTTGLLKGTGEGVVTTAEAGVDYQTPLKAGVDYAIPSAVANKQNKITAQGLLKGLGDGSVAAAEAGVDYITPEQAKPFVVTCTLNENNEIITVDKTTQEIIAAHNAKRMVLAIILDPYGLNILQLATVLESNNLVAFTLLGNNTLHMLTGMGSTWRLDNYDLAIPPTTATALPASGTALTANTIYSVATAVGTYTFTPPESGWAHGTFTTGASVSVSFSGTFMGTAPTIEASKTYEFDVLDGVWAVQEVVSA